MAVTIEAAQLRAALKLPEDDDGLARATALLAVASPHVTRYAPAAPDEVHDEAVIRTAGYLLESPTAGGVFRELKVGDDVDLSFRLPGNPVRLSGAGALLSSWRVRRAVRAEVAS